jgi:hypothetical protein
VTFALGDALLAGPRAIVRAPESYLAWVLISFVEARAHSALVLSMRRTMLSGPAPPGVGMAEAGLTALLPILFSTLLTAAALRAVLQPQARAFAYLRLGPAELRILVLEALGFAVFLGLTFAISGVVSNAMAAVGQPILAGRALLIGAVAGGIAVIRFATAPAIVLDEGRLDLAGAWRNTRGLFWRLALLLFVVAGAEEVLADAVLPRLGHVGFATPWLDPARLAQEAWSALLDSLALVSTAGILVGAYRAGRAAQTPG